MTAKKSGSNSDRGDPRKNKGLAIHSVVKGMPNAKAQDVIAAVKKKYGHEVGPAMVYMVKTKSNMASIRKSTKRATSKGSPVGPAQWIEAIKIARELLRITGGVDNATALLEAVKS
jgi:hypothetical protein